MRVEARTLPSGLLDRLLPVGLVAAFLVGLLPVLTTGFGFLDDYYVLYLLQTTPGEQIDRALVEGRPLAGALQWMLFQVVTDIDGLVIGRWVNAVILLVFALLAFRLCRALGYGRLPCWILSVGLLWLPSTQVMASWAILLMGPAAMVLGLLAASRLSAVLDESPLRLRRLAPSVALLSAGMCAYQPAAMVFWPLLLLAILAPQRSGWSASRQLSAGASAATTGLLASIVAFAVARIGVAIVGRSDSRAGLVNDPVAKLDYVLTEAFPRVFQPWTPLDVSPALSLGIAAGVAAALLITTVGGHRRRLTALGIAAAVLALSYAPSTVVSENHATARSLIGAYLVPLVVLTVVVQGVWRRSPAESGGSSARWSVVNAAIGVAVTAAAVTAGNHAVGTYFATPASTELESARQAIPPRLAESADAVVALRSLTSQSLAPGVSYDEFGAPSTHGTWVPAALTQLLIQEQSGSWHPNVRWVPRSRLANVAPRTIVVDYGNLLDTIPNEVVYRAGDVRSAAAARAGVGERRGKDGT